MTTTTARSPLATAPSSVRRASVAVVAVLLSLGCSGEPSSAQESAVPADPDVLTRRADRARVKGDTAAPVQMVEVSDFQCPYCARFYRETYPAIDSLYIRTGKVQYVWISMAAPGHPQAWPAIEAAFCAGGVGKFWPMHDLLFEHQDEWGEADRPSRHFVDYARQVGVEVASFRRCIEEDLTAPLQVQDLQSVSRAGIDATPFFIFDGQVSVRGAAGLERFRAVLDSALAAPSEGEGDGGS